MNVMKIMAILVAAAAVPSTDAARSLKAANIAAYRQTGCEHGSCDPCHDLQKIQCNADSQCEYTIGVDRNFEHGDAGSGSGCSSKSAFKRITGGGHGRIGDGEVNKAMAEMGCSQMYSHRDCKRQNEDAVGNSCAWDDCWENDYPHCVESADVKTDCAPEPEPKEEESAAADDDDAADAADDDADDDDEIAPTCAISSQLGQGVIAGTCVEGGAVGDTCHYYCDPDSIYTVQSCPYISSPGCTMECTTRMFMGTMVTEYQGYSIQCEEPSS